VRVFEGISFLAKNGGHSWDEMNAMQMGLTVTLNGYVSLECHSDDDHRV